MASGRFIVIEGIDGAGTTTQTRRLADVLAARGIACHVTREPSDGPIGRLVRRSLGGEGPDLTPQARALLFAADRLHHVEAEVAPAVAAGTWVLCDRYLLSSLAYQGLDCDETWVGAINRYARRPDATVLIDVDPEVAYERIRARADAGEGTTDLYEVPATLVRLAERYRRLADREAVRRVDGHGRVEAVTEAIVAAIADLLPVAPG